MANLYSKFVQRRTLVVLASIVVAVAMARIGHFVGMWDGPAGG